MMATRVLLSLITLCGTTLCAQTVQKCCGTSNSTFLLGNLGTSPHTQSLYLPADLTSAQAGVITRLYYRYGTTGVANGNTLGDFMVRLGQTSATTFTNGNTFFTGLDTVLQQASFSIPAGTAGDWLIIPVQSPFQYDPAQTLIVDIHFTSSTTTNFGCYGTPNNDRKLYSINPTDLTGNTGSTTWQDIGFDLDPSTGLDHLDASDVRVYPNPAQRELYIAMPAGQGPGGTVDVMDMGGHRTTLPTTTRAVPTSVDVSALAPGLYVAQWLRTDGTTARARFMKY